MEIFEEREGYNHYLLVHQVEVAHVEILLLLVEMLLAEVFTANHA